jgi:hypothetical protein
VPDSCGARVVLGRWAVRTGHDAGMQRVRRMAKRDFPCGWSGTGCGGRARHVLAVQAAGGARTPRRTVAAWRHACARQFLFHLPMFDPLKFKIFKPNSKTFE